MKALDCVQGSAAWINARLGVVTASMADSILTPGKRQPAKAEAYMNRLIAETLLRESVDEWNGNAETDRGSEMEPEARGFVEYDLGVKIAEVGFLLRDDGRLGASPDGLLSDGRGLELKCPMAPAHIKYARNPGALTKAYYGQCQVGMIVSGREEWIVCSYNPKIRSVLEVVPFDPEYAEAFESALATFLAEMDAAVEVLRPSSNPFL